MRPPAMPRGRAPSCSPRTAWCRCTRRCMARLRAGSLLALIRVRNLLLSAAGVAIGGVLAQGRVVLPGMLRLAMLSAIGLGAAGNVANDLADRDADRVNRPGRPLVSGAVSPNLAIVI